MLFVICIISNSFEMEGEKIFYPDTDIHLARYTLSNERLSLSVSNILIVNLNLDHPEAQELTNSTYSRAMYIYIHTSVLPNPKPGRRIFMWPWSASFCSFGILFVSSPAVLNWWPGPGHHQCVHCIIMVDTEHITDITPIIDIIWWNYLATLTPCIIIIEL